MGGVLPFVMMLILLQPISVEGKAKTTNLTMKVSGVPLSQVLDKIKSETEMKLVYSPADVNLNKKVTVNAENASINEVLSQALAGQGLKYTVSDDRIIISKDEPQKPKNAPKRKISGKVFDEKGIALPGVSVFIRGQEQKGTITSADGSYSIEAAKGNILVFSFVGMKNEQVEVADNSVLNVTLSESNQVLEEAVVVGYGTQRKASVVGSISSVKVSDLKIPGGSVTNALAGRMAGIVAVQRSGEPGADASDFWIRGISTFGTNNKPLILVDGIERDIKSIEADEIETFSILKDATATAVYGVRGANGVVIVTTRKGKEGTGKPTVNFRSEFGVTGPTKMPKFVNSNQFATLYNEAIGKQYYSQEAIDAYANNTDPDLYPNVDWIGSLFKDNAANQKYSLNISGGGKIARYFMSGSYYNESGLYKNSDNASYDNNVDYKRYNFRTNIDINLSKSTILEMGIAGILSTINMPGADRGDIWGYTFATSPNAFPVKYSDGKFSGPSYGTGENPYNLVSQSGYQNNWNSNIQSLFGLRQDFSEMITPGLKFAAKFSFDVNSFTNIKRFKEVETWLASSRDAAGNLSYVRSRTGSNALNYSTWSGGDRKLYLEANITYDRVFNDVHRVGALLLYNQSDYINGNAPTSILALPYRTQGIAGRATYSYNDRYFLEGNFGYNGSENFVEGKRFGFFPSVALGWIVSNEKFFEPLKDAVNLFKFKVSSGYVGNDKISDERRFVYLSTITGDKEETPGYNFGDENRWTGYGIAIGDYENMDVSWEKALKSNIGVEIELFNSKFKVQADYFFENREGIFWQRGTIPKYVGIKSTQYGNVGKMENKGIDATLEYNTKIGEVYLSAKGNYTFTRNKVLDMDSPDYTNKYRNRVGQKYDQQFGYKAIGLFESQEDIDNSPKQFGLLGLRPGDIKYADINGDGVVNGEDEIPIGYSTMPEIFYGFGGSASWKFIDFSLFFTGVSKVTNMISGTAVQPFNSTNLGRSNFYEEAYTNRWTPENPSSNVMFPRVNAGVNSNNYRASTWWQKDMSFLRLKNIELGVTIPQRITNKVKLNNVRLYVSGVNMLTFSKFKLWDPELSAEDGGSYPPSRVFNIGLNINF